ncbi:bifunctional sugar phosphate isomerase/epimerase/4-hydroxyphenylpyruvate dioxygenase family protein [Azospirillum doebereinerae]|uniref:bifunctional sugar phosphate isomerase/epimerase/4-hydroxyphenylpyruvate dioxygenase family protein n=1 Tax=Azospirillum doebereinerae TaxID=92933 RepID=UPI001EE565D4|nr:sugar phosphate isomerase/epimerase and 4-hydroxyphenylpyruvate domain-containing protein [Azospirillum doebereinerae]MCG5238475.1 sugar phosphate isomerase/epimerase and 4-hydroxyphenylpyruvate domain-containing protein [Azospirillum doebereinerae]
MPRSASAFTFAKSIATVSLSGTLPEKLEAAAAVGFDGVEIFENDLLTFDGSPADVRRIAEGLGLAITIFQPFRDFEAMPDPIRARNLDRAERKFDVMQALGTDLVLVCSNVQPHAIDDPARAAADLAEMAERAHRRGLRVGYEALAWGRHVNRWRQAWDIVNRADHPALGLIVDSFHTLSLGDDFSGLADVPGERIFFAQLADAPKLSMDVLSWSRHFRNFPGQGQLPVTEFLTAVLASGYRGPLSLEVFNDEFRSAPARLTALDGLRSLIHVEAEAGHGPGLPEPPVCDGVEFLEFAVDAAAHDKLAGLLGTLGFRHAGRHRSKAVDLYRQGGVNLVLNSEEDSAASEHFQMHGPSVCAMAFRVDDSRRAIARAEALRCVLWRERVGEGERHIPALRAPDGTLIHLVENDAAGRSIWEDDFHLLPDDGAASPAALTGIDHVAQALPFGRMDGFVLFYRAVFGFVPETLWELPDPYGLIRSRALVSPNAEPGRGVRLPLNISESRRTATGRFVGATAGAGVHHIAFASRDAGALVEERLAAGAPFLAIPANYYDDLAVKHPLDDDALAALKRRELLYDRDDHGAFLHAYTDSFEDRFFFEVVERQGDYRQFGAVNAPVRMAVQAQLREDRWPTRYLDQRHPDQQ